MIIKTATGWVRLKETTPMKYPPVPWTDWTGHHSHEEIRERDIDRKIFVSEQQGLLEALHENYNAKYLQELNS